MLRTGTLPFKGIFHHNLPKWVRVEYAEACNIPMYDEGRSEYNFGYHPKNHRSGLGHTLGDQNQPLFKSPRGSP